MEDKIMTYSQEREKRQANCISNVFLRAASKLQANDYKKNYKMITCTCTID